MTLYKRSDSTIKPVDTLDLWKRVKQTIEEDSPQYNNYTKLMEIEKLSERYKESVEIFIKLSNSALVITNEQVRKQIINSISEVLSEIGVLATKVFNSDDEIIQSASGIVTEHILTPSIKMRKMMLKLQNLKMVDGKSLDGAVESLDIMLDFLTVKSLGESEAMKYTMSSKNKNQSPN